LLFVGLQVAVFTVGSFIVFGIRAGEWNPRMFLAIPLIVCVFSYLFAMCVLFGVWMRSTVAALLMTLIIWGLYSALFWSDQWGFSTEVKFHANTEMEYRHDRSEQPEGALEKIRHLVKETLVVMPKIVPSSRLLDRYLKTRADIMADLEFRYADGDTNAEVARRMGITEADVEESISRDIGGDPAYTIGSSLIFEAVFFGLAAWLFCRRDY
jgi:hypothetical protein